MVDGECEDVDETYARVSFHPDVFSVNEGAGTSARTIRPSSRW